MMWSKDKIILRSLAQSWMEVANMPYMEERKRQWTALKDLKAERPMILVETAFIEDYITETELHCVNSELREVEKYMRWNLRHAKEVGDDITLEPCWRLNWDVEISDYGVPIECAHAVDTRGASLGYSFSNPINTPEDMNKLKPRTFKVDRERTIARKETLEDIFGDILPVVLHGSEWIHAALTQDLFKLLGMEKLMLWIYDEPEALHRLVRYLRDERISLFRWMEEEGLLGLNNKNQSAGSGSTGYTTSLPGANFAGRVRLKDLWAWMESQETVSVSPHSFAEFFLPCMAEICKEFGMIYYGCCEPLHDRWEYIRKEIPNIRAVSVSSWSDQEKMGEMIGMDFVYSRKPNPSYISGVNADWSMLKKDVEETMKAAGRSNLEFIFRDIYTINGDRRRLSKWVDMVRSMI